ncbi:MAG: hypothetical protein ACM3ZB_10140 [bacterium]|jgi:hypothetical protein
MGMNPAPAQAAGLKPRSAGLIHKIGSVLFVFFCFEVGAFLVLFPWLEPWQSNYFATFVPAWDTIWSSAYFRGAVSGLGIINIGISFSELFRLRRFSGGGERPDGSSKEVL